VENAPAIEVVRRYDSPVTLFYCDPPYPHEARGDSKAYGFELRDEQHEELAYVLHQAEGAVAVSGYACDLMDRLYGDWVRIDAPPHLCNSSKTERVESMWINYPLPQRAIAEAAGQMSLLVKQPRATYVVNRKHGRKKAAR